MPSTDSRRRRRVKSGQIGWPPVSRFGSSRSSMLDPFAWLYRAVSPHLPPALQVLATAIATAFCCSCFCSPFSLFSLLMLISAYRCFGRSLFKGPRIRFETFSRFLFCRSLTELKRSWNRLVRSPGFGWRSSDTTVRVFEPRVESPPLRNVDKVETTISSSSHTPPLLLEPSKCDGCGFGALCVCGSEAGKRDLPRAHSGSPKFNLCPVTRPSGRSAGRPPARQS